MDANAESQYRRGVAQWADRDLAGAIGTLEAVVGDGSISGHDGWWFAASRALAKIAMELDDLDRAARHLRRLQASNIGLSQTLALRARRSVLAGQPDEAAAEVAVALDRLAKDAASDVGSLMNGAIALADCGQVLVEIGYGHEASRAVEEARGRIAGAQIADPMVSGMVTLVDAGAARLCGAPDHAARALAMVDTTLSADFAIYATRERARLAWDFGDHIAAGTRYAEAAALCEAKGYISLARMVASERVQGPVPLRLDLNARIQEIAAREIDARPYAVVVRLVVDSNPGRFTDLDARATDLLAANPSRGYVDGTGTDGQIWELFLDGDDPDALWAAVRPLVEEVGAASGSTVDVRRGNGVETIGLA